MVKHLHHQIAILLGVALLFLGVFFGIHHTPKTEASTWFLSGGTVNRDNDNFIDATFWSDTPSDDDIIKALYGSGDEGSAYTQNRSGYTSGSCLVSGMTVIYTGEMPEYLSDNTIYVLTGSTYIANTVTRAGTCSAIVSNNSSGTALYTYSNRWANILIQNNNVILDNLTINGTGGGIVSFHQTNDKCIDVLSASNFSFNNINAYNALSDVIRIDQGQYFGIHNSIIASNYSNGQGIRLWTNNGLIENVHIYNNNYGLDILGENNIINNAHIYNNNIGIFIYNNNNIVNNVQIHNSSYGIQIYHSGSNNILNNIQVYNSSTVGVHFDYYTSGNIVNNIQSYNNQQGIFSEEGTQNYYFGNIDLFDNDTDIVGSGIFIAGNTGDYPGLGFSDGNISTTGVLSFDYFTNPSDKNDYFLFNWSNNWDVIQGQKIRGASSYYNKITSKYSYGKNIFGQTAPIIYSGADLVYGDNFNPNMYIGSNVLKITGELLGLSDTTTEILTTVSGNSDSYMVSTYSLFGDIINNITGIALGDDATIGLSGTDGYKRIVTQLFGNSYYATHFQENTLLEKYPPEQVILLSPASGTVFATGIISLQWEALDDVLSGYVFEIIGSGGVVQSGFTTTTGTTISLPDDNVYAYYQRRVYAIDTFNNTGARSDSRGFTIDTLICSSIWNNDNFITGSFWNTNPSDKCIIEALYGNDGDIDTAYTHIRTGYTTTTCLPTMTVIRTGTIPQTLLANTIYLISGGNYTISTPSTMANCSSLISDGEVVIGKNASIHEIYATNKRYMIIDNIDINGNGYNNFGIYFDAGHSNTINNTEIYGHDRGIYFYSSHLNAISNANIHNNTSDGIRLVSAHGNTVSNTSSHGNNQNGTYINSSLYNSINNSQFYNNSNYGIYIYSSSNNNIINNSQSYNNEFGIYINSSNGNSINNSQAYNNDQIGIWIRTSSNNSINNSQFYNNNRYGIILNSSSPDNIINNCQSYNNGYGISLDIGSTNNKYYNNLSLFANTNTNIDGTTSNLISGSASDSVVQSVGRTTGNLITTETMSRDYITNPINTTQDYLLGRSGQFSNLLGTKTTYVGTTTQFYSYGSGILTQIQPVIWSGTTDLLTGGTFDATKYIGSDVVKASGDISGLPVSDNTLTIPVSVDSLNSFVSHYSLFGDILSPSLLNTTGTSTSITLVTGLSTNKIITQLYNPISYFATHFQTETHLQDYIECNPSWNNDNFISGAFWDLDPTNSEIICALYGSGDENTAYTQHRSGWNGSQCNGIYIQVVETGSLPATLSENTIYVLTGSEILVSSPRNMANCSAVISRNETGTIFYSTVYLGTNNSIIKNIGKYSTIIDNISLDGTNNGIGGTHTRNNYGILLNSAYNNTLYNMHTTENAHGIYIEDNASDNFISHCSSYSNGSHGIRIRESFHNILEHTLSYNNGQDGIYINVASGNVFNFVNSYNNGYRGLLMSQSSDYNIIDNSNFYNNGLGGINIGDSSYTTVNNTQSYNNNLRGMLLDTTTNTIINNCQFYNNADGIYITDATDNIFNHSNTYNNTNTQIYLNLAATNNKYYGENRGILSGTTSNMTAGTSSDFPGLNWQNGTLISKTLTRDYITNPINTTGDYLLGRSGQFSNLLGKKTAYVGTITQKYSYGSGTFTQSQAVFYSGTDVVTGGTFDATKYIGSDVIKVTGDTQTIPEYTRFTGLTLTGISSDPLIDRYSFFGYLTSFPLGQTINTSTGIELMTGDGTKYIINQLWETDYFATHFQSNTFLDQTPPSQVILVSPLSGTVFATGNVSLTRTSSIDTGAGLSGYLYNVSTGIGFTDFLYSGFTTNTGFDTTNLDEGIYYRRIYAIDNIGNITASSTIRNFIVSLCGNGTLEGTEDCDQGGLNSSTGACSTSCMWNTPSCTLSVDPLTGYAPLNADYTISDVDTGWMSFDRLEFGDGTTGAVNTGTLLYSHIYTDTGTFTGILQVSNRYKNALTGQCSASLEVFTYEYCGDGIVQSPNSDGEYEVCDGEVGCDSFCQREDISCTLNISSPLYSGENTLLTGTANHSRALFSGINFGLPNILYTIDDIGSYTTGHQYSSGGTYTITMDIVHPSTGGMTNQCTGTIDVLRCGDNTINGTETCDDGSNNGVVCTPGYGSTCNYCSLGCEPILLTGEYCGDGIVNGPEQCDSSLGCTSSCTRDIPSCTLSINPLTGFAPLTGEYTLSNVDTGWMQFDRIDFGDGTTGAVNTGTLTYTHTYTLAGIFTGTLYISNSYDSSRTGQCSTVFTALCQDIAWTPDPSTICSPNIFTQTSNCGVTRQATGTRSCGGGGGTTLQTDDCCSYGGLPGANTHCEDYSPSYYDDTCLALDTHEAAGSLCDYDDENYFGNGSFTDTTNHRGFPYIEIMRLSCLHRGVGTSKDKWIYSPNTYIKKSEILKTLVKIMGIAFEDFDITTEDKTYPHTLIFKDLTPTHRFSRYSAYAYTRGLTEGLYQSNASNLYLSPDLYVSRNDIVKKIIEVYTTINNGQVPLNSGTNLSDISPSDPYYSYIRQAESLGFIEGFPQADGSHIFAGDQYVTRAAFAKMIAIPFSALLMGEEE